MDTLVIEGGHKLRGTITVSGAKNAALPLMCASLLTAEPLILENMPGLTDVGTLNQVLSGLGARVKTEEAGKLSLQADHIVSYRAPYELVSRMRASILVLGPLLARFGEADVSLPGGCAIGARPVDVVLDGLTQMGADIDLKDGYIMARAPKGLVGADIVLSKPAVTGTENLLMAATLAKGTTRLINAAREPEVVDLANLLSKMGARITGAGTDTITIEGVSRLDGATYSVMPDRIEAGTYIIAGALMGDGLTVENARPADNVALLDILRRAGVKMETTDNSVHVAQGGGYKAINLKTQPYPGFPTDLQAQMMLFLTQAEGSALLCETIYENRFMHVPELNRMGAGLMIEGNTVRTSGPAKLKAATVMATDLRASASLVLAGLLAEGTTTVRRVYHLDRGYEKLEEKLSAVGAHIRRDVDRTGQAAASVKSEAV